MRLLFVGDVMLGRLVNRALEKRPAEFPWGNTLDIFKGADARFCNLECVISDKGAPWSATPKAFHFRTDARNVRCLKAATIDAVALANNHTLDFELDAAFEMIDILDREKVIHAGAGYDGDYARSPVFFNRNGIKFGFVSFTDNEPGWEAGEDRPGVFYVPINEEDSRADDLFHIVENARANADMVIVSAHWGPNWGYRPVPEHVPFGHRLIESGADIVFGHSCHVFQGIEIFKGKPIIYSAGNFIDDYATDEIQRNDESFIFIVETKAKLITGMRLYPTIITGFHAELAPFPRAELIAARMKTLSLEFATEALWIEEEGCLKIEIEAPRGKPRGIFDM